MMPSGMAEFADHKYINLESYKKNGQPVRTPVWFVIFDDQIFITTKPDTGKVKRIRNNPEVKIMPCGMRGEPKGQWVPAKARFATEQEAKKAIELRNKKYGFKAKLMEALKYRGITPVVIAISL